MKTKTISRRKNRVEESELARMDNEIRSHKGWKGSISMQESADLLKGHAPYSYVILSGYDNYHYIVSYVDSQGMTKHKNVRIILEKGHHYFMNAGGVGPCSSFDRLIVGCFKCSPEKCNPVA